MYKIGDKFVYKRNVCEVIDIKDNLLYVLKPIDDPTLKLTIPIETNLIRDIISKEESNKLINSITSIKTIDVNDKLLEMEYKKLLNTGSLEDLVKIIKTTYIRNYNRISNNKKISEKDDNYFKKAESLLYTELSISLEIPYEDVLNYIKNKIN